MTTTATDEGRSTLAPMSPSPASARFADVVVLVTGASSGIGAAAATLFAREGAFVVATDTGPVHRVVDAIARGGGTATSVYEDLRLPDSGRLLVGDVVEIYGRLDILIHTGVDRGAVRDAASEVAGIRPDLRSGYRLARAALPAMRRAGGGSMVFTPTTPGRTAPQVTSTHRIDPGFLSLIRTLAARYAPAGVRVNGLHPVRDDSDEPQGGGAWSTGGRLRRNTPSAEAGLAYLAGSAMRARTGQVLAIDAHPWSPAPSS